MPLECGGHKQNDFAIFICKDEFKRMINLAVNSLEITGSSLQSNILLVMLLLHEINIAHSTHGPCMLGQL
jgi:hypothetical protein